MKHYPLMDKGIDISGLEPADFMLVVGVAFIFGMIGFIIIGMYTAFLFLISAVASFVLVRKFKSNKYRGYITRKLFYYMRRWHKIY